MPHSKKRSSTAYDLSEVLASPRLPLVVDSSTAISPSTYCGGTVNLIDDTVYIITSIVSQPDYLHLSPEVPYRTCTHVCSRILRTMYVDRNCASGIWRYIWIPLVGSFHTRSLIRSVCVYIR
jgi:hypothetical protein